MKAAATQPALVAVGSKRTRLIEVPTHVVIVGRPFAVEVVEDRDEPMGRVNDADTALGMTDLNKEVIRLRGGGEQSETNMRDTVLHEVLHALNRLTCCELDEEEVGRLSAALLQTLRDNPALVSCILA